MSGDPVLFESRDGIAWLTLNRPRLHNAIDLQTRDQLWSLLEVAALDNEISVLIFRGAGHTAFSAGADLRDFGTAPSLVQSRQARRERDLWQRLASFEKPMIAAVHGYALGAGCELSLYCDFRVAAEDAVFGLPEVSLGYILLLAAPRLHPGPSALAGRWTCWRRERPFRPSVPWNGAWCIRLSPLMSWVPRRKLWRAAFLHSQWKPYGL